MRLTLSAVAVSAAVLISAADSHAATFKQGMHRLDTQVYSGDINTVIANLKSDGYKLQTFWAYERRGRGRLRAGTYYVLASQKLHGDWKFYPSVAPKSVSAAFRKYQTTYRMKRMCVFGPTSSPRYALLFHRASDLDQKAIFNASAGTLNDLLPTNYRQGYTIRERVRYVKTDTNPAPGGFLEGSVELWSIQLDRTNLPTYVVGMLSGHNLKSLFDWQKQRGYVLTSMTLSRGVPRPHYPQGSAKPTSNGKPIDPSNQPIYQVVFRKYKGGKVVLKKNVTSLDIEKIFRKQSKNAMNLMQITAVEIGGTVYTTMVFQGGVRTGGSRAEPRSNKPKGSKGKGGGKKVVSPGPKRTGSAKRTNSKKRTSSAKRTNSPKRTKSKKRTTPPTRRRSGKRKRARLRIRIPATAVR